MTYFCFIESSILSVPHMEPLMADDLDEAKLEAEALLDRHASGQAAHIFEGDERVATVRPPDRASAVQHPPLWLRFFNLRHDLPSPVPRQTARPGALY